MKKILVLTFIASITSMSAIASAQIVRGHSISIQKNDSWYTTSDLKRETQGTYEVIYTTDLSKNNIDGVECRTNFHKGETLLDDFWWFYPRANNIRGCREDWGCWTNNNSGPGSSVVQNVVHQELYYDNYDVPSGGTNFFNFRYVTGPDKDEWGRVKCGIR